MSQRAPIGLLAVALATSAVLLLSLVSDLTFVGDPWEILAGRPDWSADTFLQPFNEHLILLPALVYKLLLTCFGMDSALPFYVVSISLSLLCAVLLFVYMRRRVGDWAALAGAVLVLFLGAAYEDLLWEFQMGFFGSIAAGLGALLALDREDKPGDRVASALLLVSVACSSLGIPFILAASARVALDRSSRKRRAYVPLLPLALYAIWWAGYGQSAGSEVGLEDIPDLPRYVLDAAAGGIASLLGRQPIDEDGHPPLLAQALALTVAVALVYRTRRLRQLPPGLTVALVLAFSFWVLLGLDRGPQRFSSRFQYPSAVFLLVIAAEALRGQRLPRLAAISLAVITAAALIGGVSLLHDGYSNRWEPTANRIRATLAAIEIAGPDARAEASVRLPPSISLSVEQYRDARRRHGTPAFSEAELLAAGESSRQVADRTLVATTGVRLLPPLQTRDQQRCRDVEAVNEAPEEATLSAAGRFQLENQSGRKVAVTLGRFSAVTPVHLGFVPPWASSSLRFAPDKSKEPWRLGIRGGRIRLCRVR
jgi:hypothetical protein